MPLRQEPASTRPQTYAAAMAELDRVLAERDELRAVLDVPDEIGSALPEAERPRFRGFVAASKSVSAWIDLEPRRALVGCTPSMVAQVAVDAYLRMGGGSAADADGVRAELDNAMYELRRLAESNLGLVTWAGAYHAERDELAERLVEERARNDELAGELSELRAEVRQLQFALAEQRKPVDYERGDRLDDVVDAEVHCSGCNCVPVCGCGREMYDELEDPDSRIVLWFHRDDDSPISAECAWVRDGLSGAHPDVDPRAVIAGERDWSAMGSPITSDCATCGTVLQQLPNGNWVHLFGGELHLHAPTPKSSTVPPAVVGPNPTSPGSGHQMPAPGPAIPVDVGSPESGTPVAASASDSGHHTTSELLIALANQVDLRLAGMPQCFQRGYLVEIVSDGRARAEVLAAQAD